MARKTKTTKRPTRRTTANKAKARTTRQRKATTRRNAPITAPPARQSGPIADLSGMVLWVSNAEESRRFFGETLGMKVVFSEPRFNWYEYGVSESDASIAPTEPDASWGDIESQRRRIGSHTGIIFRTNDIHKSYETLASKGVKFSKEPTASEGGSWEAEFLDSDGNGFWLIQTASTTK